MERSQSFTSFDQSNFYNNNNNNSIRSLSLNKNTAKSLSLNLRKAIEMRQMQLQQHQQNQQQQQLQFQNSSSSSDNIHKMQLNTSLHQLPLYHQPNLAKILKREKSQEFMDDSALVADFDADEEEDDDEDDERMNEEEIGADRTLLSAAISPIAGSVSNNQIAPSKLLPFQPNKRQSPPAHFILHSISVPAASCCSPSSSSTTSSCSASSVAERRRRLKHECSFDFGTHPHRLVSSSTETMSPLAARRQNFSVSKIKRDNSIHSDSSCYSSVDSLLEARKPDPEAILINLGFGPIDSEDILSRIPKRFLKPSQVRGIDTDAFVKRLQLASSLADHSVLGYRGLTGNPDIPPSTIVAKIMERFEVNQRKKSMGSMDHVMR